MTASGPARRQRQVKLGTIVELPTKRQARDKLRELMGAPEVPRTEMTLQEVAEKFRQARMPAMKESSADYLQRKLRAPMAAFGGRDVSMIGRFEVESFLAEQAKKYWRNTLRGFRSSLSSLLGWAVECGWS